MVRVREEQHILDDGRIDLEAWLQHIAAQQHYVDHSLIRNACILSQLAGQEQSTETGESCLQQGLAMAEILAELDLDQETLAAAIVYESMQYADLSIEDIKEQLGPAVAKLVAGVERMSAIDLLQSAGTRNRTQLENIRKMMLAMVDDVRIVLIKLAERLRVLRTVARLSDSVKRHIGQQVMNIYAPLANRLGIGQIKWEMEDLAFRYLQPQKYKEIASGLNTRRVERDEYVIKVVNILTEEINKAGVKHADVYGRSKHIHSIFRKMQRKNVDLSQIFDATAVRVLVDTVEDCYTVLGIVHNLWQSIPEEFDDYISNPKPNGYSSLHTAVVGPEDRVFEVQVRTHQMHESAELGVAAHWRYKEGAVPQKESHERKIEWLREVMAWQKELASQEETMDQLDTEFLEDRVYVFTPGGDIVDLPTGATPLDFAYNIHSEVGHRCRGAKVNDKLVQLTHQLATGDTVEILTAKQGQPSRDWLNPHLGYVISSRSKAKIHQWFRQQDFDKNLEDGKTLIEKELNKLDLPHPNFDKIAHDLNYKKGDDLLAALGRGDIRRGQIINRLMPEVKPAPSAPTIPVFQPEKAEKASDLNIEGVGNLLTHMAKCCQPIPGDDIVGYVTLGRGISIHRSDCINVLNANTEQQDRILKVEWGSKTPQHYPVDITISAYDRPGLVHDVTALLSQEKASIIALSTNTNKQENTANINITTEFASIDMLSRILHRLAQIPNVIEAKRVRH